MPSRRALRRQLLVPSESQEVVGGESKATLLTPYPAPEEIAKAERRAETAEETARQKEHTQIFKALEAIGAKLKR